MLSANQRKALAALLVSKSRVDAARVCGLSTKTLQGYEKLPEFAEALEKEPNFSAILNAVTTEIRSGGITYTDKEGTAHDLSCDSVVLSCGFTAKGGETMSYASCAPEYYAIGDCDKVANLQKAIRSGFSIGRAI